MYFDQFDGFRNSHSSPIGDRRLISNRRNSQRNSPVTENLFGSYSYHVGDCCPLVIDPIALALFGSFLAAAVYLLNTLIATSMLMMRRRRRRELNFITDFISKGKQTADYQSIIVVRIVCHLVF